MLFKALYQAFAHILACTVEGKRGLVAVRSSLTALLFVAAYTRMTIGLTAYGRQIAHKLAMHRNVAWWKGRRLIVCLIGGESVRASSTGLRKENYAETSAA